MKRGKPQLCKEILSVTGSNAMLSVTGSKGMYATSKTAIMEGDAECSG